MHWLERTFWRGGRIAVLKAVAATLCAAALLKLRGASIIWTAHDPVPHDMKGNAIFRRGAFYWLWRVYSHLLVAMTDGVILLSATHRDILAATYPGLMRKASARSEEHTSELQSLMRISYAVFCLKKKKKRMQQEHTDNTKIDRLRNTIDHD